MNPVEAAIGIQRLLILDGGLATELERRGADLNHPLWSARMLVENPALIRDAHLGFLEAGADVIVTASHQTRCDLRQWSSPDDPPSVPTQPVMTGCTAGRCQGDAGKRRAGRRGTRAIPGDQSRAGPPETACCRLGRSVRGLPDGWL